MIGLEVGAALVKYINFGTSIGAVNFPEIDLRAIQVTDKSIRLLFCHYNVPGVLKVFHFKKCARIVSSNILIIVMTFNRRSTKSFLITMLKNNIQTRGEKLHI